MNIRNGCFVGGLAPYGYLKSKGNCHKLVVDEYAANIVRRIFEMAADGKRVADILEWLNSNGILTPSHYALVDKIMFFPDNRVEIRWKFVNFTVGA